MSDKDKNHRSTKYPFRDLANYIAMHPKAKGATTLTEARKRAFGMKKRQTKGKQ